MIHFPAYAFTHLSKTCGSLQADTIAHRQQAFFMFVCARFKRASNEQDSVPVVVPDREREGTLPFVYHAV